MKRDVKTKTRSEIDNEIRRYVQTMAHVVLAAVPITVTGPPGGSEANWTAGSDELYKDLGMTAASRRLKEWIDILRMQYDISD